jgi:CelD/BcsL family acetyltransferase involved in cellulose biosynthesis
MAPSQTRGLSRLTHSVERFDSIAAALGTWQQLLAADPHGTFFSTPAWLTAWWEHRGEGRELLLLVVRHGNDATGFAPLMIERIPAGRAVLFLGSGLSDYAEMLVDESRAERRYVVYAVLDYLAQQYGDALFDLQEMPEGSPTPAIVAEWIKQRRLPSVTTLQDVCPIIALPETAEQYHKELKKSFLADIRRGERRLRERGEVVLVDHSTPERGDWTALRDQMSDLQSQRMRTKGEVPMWQGPLGHFVKDILQAADAAGALRLTGLYLDGQLIAYELCFLHRTTIYAWSRAFAEEYRNTGPGKIALLHLLETGIDQGYRVFDLLRGEEPYKALWTNGQVQNYRVTFLVRPSVGARLVYKYRTSWKAQLQKLEALRKLNRFAKSLRRG